MRKIRFGITFKSVSAIVFWLVLFTLIVINIGYIGFTGAVIQQLRADAFRIADFAALDIDAGQMAPGRVPEALAAKLERLRDVADVDAIELLQPDPADYGRVTTLFSAVSAERGLIPREAGSTGPVPNNKYQKRYQKLWTLKSERESLTVNEAARHYIDVMIPIKGADGHAWAILSVQRGLNSIIWPRRVFVRNVFLGLLVLIIIVIFGQGAFQGRVIIRPIKRVSEEAVRFANENTLPTVRLGSVIRNTDEIGLLADRIDNMEDQIGLYVKDITRITAERERISAELSMAEAIQASMLPHTFPPFPNRDEFELYASMDPAREVGGDFYDFFLVDDDHLCLVIADVSGKGIPAALFMTMSKTILKNTAMLGKSPTETLTIANQVLCTDNQMKMFVTVWIGMLEISTGKLISASAGHEYPAIRRANGAFELFKDKHGFVLGGIEGMRYKETTLQLEPGDVLFVYTDGLPEATDIHERQFGTERMLSALNTAPSDSPERLLDHVRGAVDAFVGTAEQFDDLTMLCIRYR